MPAKHITSQLTELDAWTLDSLCAVNEEIKSREAEEPLRLED